VAGRLGRDHGGIYSLDLLIQERRGPLEYDFRTRFHLPLSSIGGDVGLDEAVRLIQILRADPSSMLAASVEGWSYPLPRTDAILMDQYDLAYAATGAKGRKPYPRPFAVASDKDTQRHGNVAGRTPEQVKAILREQFGQPEHAAPPC
jgi:hypothetical protein